MLISKDLRRRTARLPILLFILICVVVPVSGQESSALRKGTYEHDCMGYTFHLAGSRGSRSADELTLRLEWRFSIEAPAWTSGEWYEVKAKRCSTKSGECEDTAKAKIQFDRIGKHIAGGFAAEFANKRQEGKFDVKYHHIGPKFICE
jgi:hypothetical protein